MKPSPERARELAERFEHLREQAGLSAREFDRLAALTPGQFGLMVDRLRNRLDSDIESRTAVAYCRVVGASVEWLLTGDGSPPTPRRIQQAVEKARRAAA